MTGWMVRIAAVRVGIVDVGANTLRLLVATREQDRLVSVREQRVQLGLGEEIERSGALREETLIEAAAVVGAYVRRARKLGCDWIEVVVASPGRQAQNGAELTSILRETTGVPTKVLRPEEEGELAWYGAVSMTNNPADSVAVCDVGGGSTQLAVGTVSGGPAWVRSVDLGSLRLTRRTLTETPPPAGDLDAARAQVEAAFDGLAPPLALAGIATGGTARALRRIVGDSLQAETLESAVRKLAKRSDRAIADEYGVDPARAHTLLAGTLILIEVQRRLGIRLEVGRGGIREGAALLALEELAKATA
jgi:exopolyphosphatase/guanosine-5'-triphosphate,3'-diphosphate pyrophosphatase